MLVEQSAGSNILVLTGPSGVGKDSILTRFMEKARLEGKKTSFVVTHTDRDKRPGEIDKANYHFVSPDTFSHMVEAGDQFVEWVWYGEGKNKCRKGTSFDALLNAQGDYVILRIDPVGASNVVYNFNRGFGPDHATKILSRTTVVYLGVNNLMTLVTRQRARDHYVDIDRVRQDYKVWQEICGLGLPWMNLVINNTGQVGEVVNRIFNLIHDPSKKVFPTALGTS